MMETATTLSKDIQTAAENARYDTAVKCLLANKIILAQIVKSCAEEFRDIDTNEIASRYIEGEPQISETPVMPDETNQAPKVKGTGVEDPTITEGSVTYDIRFNAVAPKDGGLISLIINCELQNDFYPGYPPLKRGLYYCSRMISSQYGTVFTQSHYERICKVYSIWLFPDPPRERVNTITKYSITEENCIGHVREDPANYDLLTAVMICLGGPENGNYEGILKLLGTLLSPELPPEDKKQILEQDFDIPMTEKLERMVFDVCDLSLGVMEKGFQKGMQKGMQEGMQQGMQQGIESAKIESIVNLMRNLKLTAEQAMDALGIPENEQSKFLTLIEA